MDVSMRDLLEYWYGQVQKTLLYTSSICEESCNAAKLSVALRWCAGRWIAWLDRSIDRRSCKRSGGEAKDDYCG